MKTAPQPSQAIAQRFSSILIYGGKSEKLQENNDDAVDRSGIADRRFYDDMLLGEGTFLYDVTQEKLYVTISADGVTCSTSDAADAPADVPPVLTLPILDEIDQTVTIGTSGS